MPQHRQHCHCSVIVPAVVPAAATRRCHTSHRGTRRLGLSESDEQEAVNGRTGASVQLADSPPGPLASRVPDRLPVQQLILFASTAVPVTVQTRGVQSRVLALHAGGVALPEVQHPAGVRAVAAQAARRDGRELELHTVPCSFIAISCSSFSPRFSKPSCRY